MASTPASDRGASDRGASDRGASDRGASGQRDDDPVVEFVVEAEALEEIATDLQADASLFGDGARAYASGVQDAVEAIRELARGRVADDAQR